MGVTGELLGVSTALMLQLHSWARCSNQAPAALQEPAPCYVSLLPAVLTLMEQYL
jgi:hypothetical protein